MDLIQNPVQRQKVFEKTQAIVLSRSAGMQTRCFGTSIWDETLYKAWSAIVYSLIPDIEVLERQLRNLCEICEADEIVLFEHATFLVVAQSTAKPHSDIHRFEKISNIIKQFKLCCGKSMAQFQSMEVRNSNFAAFIDVFTANTYVMVIVGDHRALPAVIHSNLKSARSAFEKTLLI